VQSHLAQLGTRVYQPTASTVMVGTTNQSCVFFLLLEADYFQRPRLMVASFLAAKLQPPINLSLRMPSYARLESV